MTLVDKLEGIHIGDLILLKSNFDKPEVLDMVGYVANYSYTEIVLSNTCTKEKGEIRAVGFMDRCAGEKITKVSLEWFDSYEILKKYGEKETESRDNPQ